MVRWWVLVHFGHERLVTSTHFEQSNYLANQKEGGVNKYDLNVFIRLFQESYTTMKAVHVVRVPRSLSSSGFNGFDS